MDEKRVRGERNGQTRNQQMTIAVQLSFELLVHVHVLASLYEWLPEFGKCMTRMGILRAIAERFPLYLHGNY